MLLISKTERRGFSYSRLFSYVLDNLERHAFYPRIWLGLEPVPRVTGHDQLWFGDLSSRYGDTDVRQHLALREPRSSPCTPLHTIATAMEGRRRDNSAELRRLNQCQIVLGTMIERLASYRLLAESTYSIWALLWTGNDH